MNPSTMSNADLDNVPILHDRFGRGSSERITNDLMAPIFPPLKAIVPGYVYGGFTVLAGRSLGKTWLAIDRRPRADLILRQHPRLHLPDTSPPRLAECIFPVRDEP